MKSLHQRLQIKEVLLSTKSLSHTKAYHPVSQDQARNMLELRTLIVVRLHQGKIQTPIIGLQNNNLLITGIQVQTPQREQMYLLREVQLIKGQQQLRVIVLLQEVQAQKRAIAVLQEATVHHHEALAAVVAEAEAQVQEVVLHHQVQVVVADDNICPKAALYQC